jgi:hypothetical protein
MGRLEEKRHIAKLFAGFLGMNIPIHKLVSPPMVLQPQLLKMTV